MMIYTPIIFCFFQFVVFSALAYYASPLLKLYEKAAERNIDFCEGYKVIYIL